MPDAIDFGPVPPLVIGVTGVMQFQGGDRDAVKAEVKRFLWQFVDDKPPPGELKLPTHKDWRPLPATPIAILTSLAPGADLLMAEVAGELEEKYQEVHKGRPGKLEWKFKVYAPLPFPVKQFKEASTFTGARGSADDKTRAKAMLDKLEAEHHTFWVPLKEDHAGSEKLNEGAGKEVTQAQLHERRREWLEARLNDDLTKPSRYRLRYRAAGEYIAAHSHMLIVLNEQVFDGSLTPDEVRVPVASELTGNDFPYGSRLILELKRQGITPELLRSEVAFTWSDSGPVVHFYTPKEREADEPVPPNPPKVGAVNVLYPVDSRTREGKLSHTDKTWEWEGGAQFGTVIEQLDSYNRWAASHVRVSAAAEPMELDELVALPAAVTAAAAPPAVREYRSGLDRLARARCRASHLADRVYTGRWKFLLLSLFVLTFFAALLVHVANHWHVVERHGEPTPAAHPDTPHPPAGPPPHAAQGNTPLEEAELAEAEFRVQLTMAAGLILLVAYLWFIGYKGLRQEEFRFDYRALAEGVRVQVYWAAAGLAQSVPANYMQRQRNEMVWIRRAITALAAPYSRWADGFAALAEGDQLAVLKSVVARWVRWDEYLDPSPGKDEKEIERAKRKAQTGYMERAGFMEQRSEHFWKRFGFDLTLIGLAHLLVWGRYLFHPDLFDVGVWAWLAWAGGGLLLVAYLVLCGVGAWRAWKNSHTAGQHHGFPPQAYCWRGKRTWWAAALGGFVWARECVYPYAHLWGKWDGERRLPKRFLGLPARQGVLGLMRWVNAGVVVAACTLISYGGCVLLGLFAPALPKGDVWWAIAFGTLLLAGALCIAWPERHSMAEHSRQYEAMWAMFQAAGRRLVGHIRAAEGDLARNDLAQFRGRVKAIQELLYQVGLQALDENAEWLMLHRSRPLEPLMAG